jgi:uncharacterized membrane protein YfcA
MDALDVTGLVVLGFVAGAAGGLLGVGGGIVFVPALVVFAHLSQLHALATSLVAIALVAIVGAARQRAYGNVRLRDGLVIGVLAPVGVLAGVVARVFAERDDGRGVLLVSLEFEEIRALADRILVIYEGEIVGEFPPDVSEEELGVAMTGGAGQAVA